jgi:hypothetical protein
MKLGTLNLELETWNQKPWTGPVSGLSGIEHEAAI